MGRCFNKTSQSKDLFQPSTIGFTLSLRTYTRPLSRAWATINCLPRRVSYDGVAPSVLFRKQHFTSDPQPSPPRIEEEENDGSEAAGSQQQEIDDLGVSSFIPFKVPEPSERLDPEAPRRIHVLFKGHLAKLVAYAISGIPNPPPITLLFSSSTALHQWRRSDQSIEVVTEGMGDKRDGYEVEIVPLLERENLRSKKPVDSLWGESDAQLEERPEESDAQLEERLEESDVQLEESLDEAHGTNIMADSGIIHHLIVALSAQTTVLELSRLADRLTKNSTIVFMQNGLGIVEEVNKKVFPNEMTRPSYLIGLVTHEVYRSYANQFSVVHSRMGTIALGSPLRSLASQTYVTNLPRSKVHLLRTLTRTPDLAAVGLFPIDVFQMKIERVAIHAVIYPLTVLFDCRNGGLRQNDAAHRVCRFLLAEISLVIRSLPELQGVPNVNMRFSPDRLERLIRSTIISTARQTSSMLTDVRAARRTEIDYLNGYIVRRGEEMGIKCVMNYMLMQMVKAKSLIVRRKEDRSLPLDPSEAV